MHATSSGTLKTTPLNALHRQLGARMVEFAGWDMPVEYSGVIDEHVAVRTRAGLFDVSHMGEVEIAGTGALDALQRMTSNDASRLQIGQAQYSALTTPAGTFVDDLLVYRLAADHFLLVVNAANTDKDVAWIRGQAGAAAAVVDSSARYALIAIQGPLARDVLQPLTGVELGSIRYYWFARGEVAHALCMISRTGYTGEDGFEIFVPPARAAQVWTAILEAGRDQRVVPAGLGARDTLRLEAAMRLYGNDIDDTTTVLEADLGWIVGWEKGAFIGRDVLVAQRDGGVKRKLVGFEMVDRGIARHGYPVLAGGQPAGQVSSGSYAPFLKKNIGMAYLPIDRSAPGSEFEVDIRGRRAAARVVPLPFYKRPRKT